MSGSLVRAACTVLVLSTSACTLVDRRTLDVEPAGALLVAGVLRLRVVGDAERFRADVDGHVVARDAPVGATVELSLAAVPDGRHTLTIHALGVEQELSIERELWVDRSPLVVDVTPTPGQVGISGPLTVEFTLSHDAVSFAATLHYAQGSVRQLALDRVDARIYRAALPVRMGDVGKVTVDSRATDRRGLEVQRADSWFIPDVQASFVEPAADLLTSGAFDVRLAVDAGAPPLDLLLGGVRVATLSPPDWSARVDPAALPEGTHVLTVSADAAAPVRLRLVTERRVIVDRTAPTVFCTPLGGAEPDVGVQSCLLVSISEPVLGLDPRLLVAGRARTALVTPAAPYSPLPGHVQFQICPTDVLTDLPAIEQVDLGPGVTDAAGVAALRPACSLTLPAFLSPWGTLGLVGPGVSRAAVTARRDGYGALVHAALPDDPYGLAHAELLVPGGVRSRAMLPVAPGKSLLGVAVGGDPLVENGVALAFSTRDDSGAHVETQELEYHWPLAALLPGEEPALSADGFALAVTDDSGAGRVVRVAVREEPFAGWSPIALPAQTGTTASSPSVVRDAAGLVTVAWAEEPASGGPAVLRVAAGDPVAGFADLAAPFATGVTRPSVALAGMERVLAWEEGARVLASVSVAGVFGPAEPLASDPSHAARDPQALAAGDDPIVVFIETTPAGDEVLARRWNGGTWVLVDERATTSPGAVAELFGDGAGTFGWIDGAGWVHARSLNR